MAINLAYHFARFEVAKMNTKDKEMATNMKGQHENYIDFRTKEVSIKTI